MVDGVFHLVKTPSKDVAKQNYYITLGAKRKVFSYIIIVKFGVLISTLSDTSKFPRGHCPFSRGVFDPFRAIMVQSFGLTRFRV